MALAFTRAICLVGLGGHVVDVEAQSAPGLPAVTLVGLPDAALREAKERVRAAISSIRVGWKEMRTTVNLSPAGVPKSGTAFDLALAVAMLGSQGLLRAERARNVVHLGELGLDGRLLPVRGILPAVSVAASQGYRRVIVPAANAKEAQLIPDVEVVAVEHLADVVTHYGGHPGNRPNRPAAAGENTTATQTGGRTTLPDGEAGTPDLREVVGQTHARRALEIAAAGGHHLFLLGSPGAGKTMLAERLPGIMPPLKRHDALEVTALHSLAGTLARPALMTTPPFQSPHHSATMPAILGGGSGLPRPGAASLAHAGVLFLDEAPEFAARVLDSLRQPMESGQITLHRAAGTATYPARFQLVLAANPCPCGNALSETQSCQCRPMERRRYAARLSGPLLDRVDMQVVVQPVSATDLRSDPGEASAQVAERVWEARRRAAHRWKDHPWQQNSQIPGSFLRSEAGGLSPISRRLLRAWMESSGASLRAVDRVLRVAWTAADLDGSPSVGEAHLAAAFNMRMGGHDGMVAA